MCKSDRIKSGFVAGVILFLFSFPAAARDIAGVWLTEKDESKIEIYRQNGEYFGKIIWIRDPKKQKAVGVLTLKNFVMQEDETYEGSVYAPHLDKNVKGVITVRGEEEIEIRGYLGFFSGKQVWKRVKQAGNE